MVSPNGVVGAGEVEPPGDEEARARTGEAGEAGDTVGLNHLCGVPMQRVDPNPRLKKKVAAGQCDGAGSPRGGSEESLSSERQPGEVRPH